jgi:aspartyl-tRNA(Asn)/glutamyl-tRNA(Gln) amidotransferase subunit A
MSLTDIDRMTAKQLLEAMRRKELSSKEITERAFERLEETDKHLNAFVHIDRKGALQAADQADQERLRGDEATLLGLPLSVKDLIDVAGMPCQFGSLTMTHYIPDVDAPSVQRVRAAGAVIIGKTSTSEFGYRGYTKSLVHGNTRNPWDLERTPGGSSGGAVASVAAGVTSLALATDGGGSIRAPCSLTGLIGIKATFGRVPVWPASATPTLAHVGPVARTVQDAELLLSVIAGSDVRDPFSLYPDIDWIEPAVDFKKLRIAYSPTLGYAKPDRDVADYVTKAINSLRHIWPHIEEVDYVCPDPAEILSTEFIGGCSARLGDAVTKTPELIDPPLLQAIQNFRKITSDTYSRIMRRRLEHREILRKFFEKYDLLITPTVPCCAWNINSPLPTGHEEAAVWSYYTYPFNLGHQPAGTIPCGTGKSGMPIGLQFIAPLLKERVLIEAMSQADAYLNPVTRMLINIVK